MTPKQDQNQPYVKYRRTIPAVLYKKSCSEKCCKLYGKTLVTFFIVKLLTLSSELANLQRLNRCCFSVNVVKISEQPFYKTRLSDCFGNRYNPDKIKSVITNK